MRVASVDPGYSDREVARLTHLTLRQVRALARAGVAGEREPRDGRPHGAGLRFVFRDLPVLRTVHRLLRGGLTLGRAGRALGALRRQLARRNLPLSGAQCFLAGNKVLASDGSRCWDVETGHTADLPASQGLASLRPLPPPPTAAPAATFVHPLLGQRAWAPRAFVAGHGSYEQADAWFGRGVRAEQRAPSKACGYYLQAIACNPEHVEALINLGHLCAAERDAKRASAFFRLATRIDPDHAVAHYNLAVILHDEGANGAAMQAYRRAILLDPNFADAHFNLGTLLAQQGHSAEAGTHFSAFRAATQSRPPQA